MKNKNTKGFTLIELLIVILIIGILAVAFLPTVFGAPSKARDQARVADLSRIQKVLVAEGLSGSYSVPAASGCVSTAVVFNGASHESVVRQLGGVLPTDPSGANHSIALTAPAQACPGEYLYLADAENYLEDTGYSFALYAHIENPESNGNVECAVTTALGVKTATIADITDALAVGPSSEDTNCFAILQSK